MSAVQYAVRQDHMFVAKVDVTSDEETAKREAMHYLAVYAEDGEAELWLRSAQRKWKPLGIIMGEPKRSVARCGDILNRYPCAQCGAASPRQCIFSIEERVAEDRRREERGL